MATAQPFLFDADAMPGWPWGRLEPHAYDFVMADPPWRFETYSPAGQEKGPEAHYSTMSTAAIAALPVRLLLQPSAILLLWATWPMLDDARAVLDAWGLRYVSGGVWLKKTVHGKDQFGTGYRLRSANEPWLLGVIGEPVTSRSHRNQFEGQVRGHSRKPESGYAWAEGYMPAARRVELFSRSARKGWDAWGNETGKFDAEAEAPHVVT